MSGNKWWALSAGALWLMVSGCTCGEANPVNPSAQCTAESQACQSDDQCPERHLCKADKNSGARCCERSPRTCSDAAGCCPGQVCNSEGRCVDKFDECSTDSDCGEGGDRVCEAWVDPVLGTSRRCTSKGCTLGECPVGQFCMAGACVASPPCNGACPEGTACVPNNNRCHPYGTRCNLPPKEGHLVVFTKPENVYDVCLMAEIACEYAELPPLASTGLGKHASIDAAGTRLVVAHYDGIYGDLVVTDFDAAGSELSTSWIDGIPASGTVVFAPSGPRGGIIERGDDVGLYTDVAAKPDGTVYVSYYDNTHGDLRFAERDTEGNWSTHLVDGAAADLGLFTSLALDSEGKPAIAYYQRAGSNDPSVSCPGAPGADKALITGLKLARAKVLHPRSPTDWSVELVSCAARPPPPCYGCATPGGQVCAKNPDKDLGGTLCANSSIACSPPCASGKVCIESGAASVCGTPASAIEILGIPLGHGLFPSLAFKDLDPVIAFHDSVKGDLVVARKSGTWTLVTLDGRDANADTGNVGLYPSLSVGADASFKLAYHDWTRRGLRFYNSPALAPVENQRRPSVSSYIDRGLSAPQLDGPSWVGADATLIQTSFGTFAAYQNSTTSDLRLARWDTGIWRPAREWTEGAVGFFADAVELNGKLYIVHTQLHSKAVAGRAIADNTLKLEIFEP